MKIAFDSRCETKGPISFTRVLALLRSAADSIGIEHEDWTEGPCRADVLWSPNSDIPSLEGVQKVGTLHDINPLLPDGRPGWKRFFRVRHLLKGVDRLDKASDWVVTGSEFSKSSILKYFPHLEPKLKVVPNFPDAAFHSGGNHPELAEFRLPGNSVLFLSALRRHKGWDTLLEAWCGLPHSTRKEHPLILAGSNHRVGARPFKRAAHLGVKEDLFLPGIIPDSELPALYQSASVFVFPSLAEGFGLPPLEAMACGTPVIAAQSTSLPEVLGDACLWFEPGNSGQLEELLRATLSSSDQLSDLKRRGLNQAQKWSARRTGLAMQEILEDLSV